MTQKELRRRVYRATRAEDRLRVLVDRLWPRSLSRLGAPANAPAATVAVSGPLRHSASAQWKLGDARHHFLYTRCNGPCDSRIAGESIIGGDLSKIGDGLLRVFDPHAFPSRAKAALTSSSLAASSASPWSIFANSSGVALYSAPAKFCLDFERKLYQLLLPVFRPSRDAFQYCLNFVLGQCRLIRSWPAGDCFVA
jgi:hypothetical protein